MQQSPGESNLPPHVFAKTKRFFSAHPIPKPSIYFLFTAVGTLTLLRLTFSDLFIQILEVLFVLIPVFTILINALIARQRTKNETNEKVRSLIYHRSLFVTLRIIGITLLLYIIYAPRAFVPFVKAFSSLVQLVFTKEGFFLFLAYLSLLIIASATVLIGVEAYRRTCGTYKHSIRKLFKKTLYATFFLLLLLLLISIAAFPGSYSPITDYLAGFIGQGQTQVLSERNTKTDIAQNKRVLSLKDALAQTADNLTGSLSETNQDFSNKLNLTTNELLNTTTNLQETLKEDLDTKVSIYGDEMEDTLYSEDIIPNSDDDFDLGSGSKHYNTVYVNNLETDDTLYVDGELYAPTITTQTLEVNGSNFAVDGDLDVNSNAIVNIGSNDSYFTSSGDLVLDNSDLTADSITADSITTSSLSLSSLTVTGDITQDGDTLDETYLKLTGGTLTGALTLAADPAANLQAATKQYVDNNSGGNTEDGTADGQMLFWDDGDSEWKHSDTTELFWDNSSGRLGIGTNSPGAALQVYSATNPGMIVGDGTAGYLKLGDGTISKVSGSGFSVNSSLTASSFVKGSGLYLTGGGIDFNHGLSSGGGNVLFKSADLISAASLSLGTTNQVAALNTLDVVGGVAIGSYGNVNTAPSNGMIISGSVGIGTTGPDRKLDILDASNPQLRLTYTDGSVYTDFQTDASGYLNINPSGDRVIIDDEIYFQPSEAYTTAQSSSLVFNPVVDSSSNRSDIWKLTMTRDDTADGGESGKFELWGRGGTSEQLRRFIQIDDEGRMHWRVDENGYSYRNASAPSDGLWNFSADNLVTDDYIMKVRAYTNAPQFLAQGATDLGGRIHIYGSENKNDNLSQSAELFFKQNTSGNSSTVLHRLIDSSYTISTGIEGTATAPPIYFAPGGSTRVVMETSGNVGIGTTGPDRKLDILDASSPQLRLTYTDGSVYTDFQTDSSGYLTITPSGSSTTVTGDLTVSNLTNGPLYSSSGTLTNTDPSDQRLKTNINSLDGETILNGILALNPVSFEWKNKQNGERIRKGFIAQEVEKIFPELIGKIPQGYKGIYSQDFIPYLTKALQQHHEEFQIFKQAVAKQTASLEAVDVQITQTLEQDNQEFTDLIQKVNQKIQEVDQSLEDQNENIQELTLTIEFINESIELITEQLNDHGERLKELEEQLAQINPEFETEVETETETEEAETADIEILADNLLATGEVDNLMFKLDGSLKVEELIAQKVKSETFQAGQEAAGKAQINAGQSSVFVANPNVKESDKIYVTPTGPTFGKSLFVDNIVEGSGFEVKFEGEVLEGIISFNWFMLE